MENIIESQINPMGDLASTGIAYYLFGQIKIKTNLATLVATNVSSLEVVQNVLLFF